MLPKTIDRLRPIDVATRAGITATVALLLATQHVHAESSVAIAAAAASGVAPPAVSNIPTAAMTAQSSSDARQPEGASTELAALQARIPILEARKKIATLEKDIRHLQSDEGPSLPSGVPGPLPGPVGIDTSIPPIRSSTRSVSDLALVGTGFYDSRAIATVSIDGVSRDVHVGDPVGNGWTVRSIDPASVTLIRGKQTQLLRL